VSAFIAPFYVTTGLPIDNVSTATRSLTLVLGLSFTPLLGRAIAAGWRTFLLAGLLALGAAAAYSGWHVIFDLLAPWVDGTEATSDLKWSIVVDGLVFLFVAQSILQTSPNGWFSNWLQPHLLSGLYIDDWFTRVTFRLWPPGLQ
jgi:NAD(P)H-quinone oxidoreductase subunit 5